jgi:KUP system potassium uptake protein
MENTPTTIRIADVPHPRGGDDQAISSAIEDSIYRTRSFTRRDAAAADDIYNIRSRSRSRDTRGGAGTVTVVEDEDPGLRQPGDYKQKQVCEP